MIIDKGYVVKEIDSGKYFCGLSVWDTQLRKAQIYHSKNYAQMNVNTHDKPSIIVPVEIRELDTE